MAALLGAAVPQHSWEAISSPLISEEGIAPPWLGGENFCFPSYRDRNSYYFLEGDFFPFFFCSWM